MDKKRLPQPMTRIMLSPTDVTPPYHNIQRNPWVLFAIFTLPTRPPNRCAPCLKLKSGLAKAS